MDDTGGRDFFAESGLSSWQAGLVPIWVSSDQRLIKTITMLTEQE